MASREEAKNELNLRIFSHIYIPRHYRRICNIRPALAAAAAAVAAPDPLPSAKKVLHSLRQRVQNFHFVRDFFFIIKRIFFKIFKLKIKYILINKLYFKAHQPIC